METIDEKEEFLNELQRFLDLLENIEDEKLKKRIVYQVLKLEKLLKNKK